MGQFDIAHFENRVDALIAAHSALLSEHRSLRQNLEREQQRNRELRERLNGVIERIRALEAEAHDV